MKHASNPGAGATGGGPIMFRRPSLSRLMMGALALIALSSTASPSPAEASTSPIALSPGGERFEEVASACPTFSWTAISEAAGYELVAYRTDEDGSIATQEPVLRLALPGGASSWTPSAQHCLAPGEHFAWLVRALKADGSGGWSEAKLFRVPSRPSDLEVARAVEVLPDYLVSEGAESPEPGRNGVASSAPRENAPNGPRATTSPTASLGSGPVAMRGERPETTGAAFGLVGVVNTAEGAALAGENTAGGADLLLAGAPAAAVTENRWELDSATPQVFAFDNPSGDLTLMVNGETVLAGAIDSAEIQDGTLLFADLAQNGCTSGEVPQWSGSAWVCATPASADDADTLDGVDSLSLLRSDESDSFTSGTLTFDAGTTLDASAATLSAGTMTKTGTKVVTNLNADLLDGNDGASFFVLSDNETVTGIPSFNGGTSGVSAPFFVDSNTAVANLNADLLDGNDASTFAAAAHDHFGETWSGNTTGSGLKVENANSTDSPAAITGHATATTDVAIGLVGQSDSSSGRGIYGIAGAAGGTGIWGQASATSGSGAGVRGESASASGYGGLFINTGGGDHLLVGSSWTPHFRVSSGGDAFTSGVIPRTDDTYSLGASGAKWTEVWATNGTIQTSDLRLKKDVTDLGYGLDELLALRPVSFRWKTGAEERRLGFVAQEAAELVPEVIERGDDSEGLLGMRYAELVPLLVKAIQDQQAEIRRLAGRVADLETGQDE